MTLYRWLELVVLLIGIGASCVAVVCLASWAAVTCQRLYYRWRVRRYLSKLDQMSLSGIARYRRDA